MDSPLELLLAGDRHLAERLSRCSAPSMNDGLRRVDGRNLATRFFSRNRHRFDRVYTDGPAPYAKMEWFAPRVRECIFGEKDTQVVDKRRLLQLCTGQFCIRPAWRPDTPQLGLSFESEHGRVDFAEVDRRR
jgi:hypothetical protein